MQEVRGKLLKMKGKIILDEIKTAVGGNHKIFG